MLLLSLDVKLMVGQEVGVGVGVPPPPLPVALIVAVDDPVCPRLSVTVKVTTWVPAGNV